jgi:exodeoxyribonuclease X
MIISVLDTETTGLVPGDVVEIAKVDVQLTDEDTNTWAINDRRSALVRPSCPISYEAMACHHITNEMVEVTDLENPGSGDGMRSDVMSWFDSVSPFAPVVAAHNAAFDRQFLPELADRKWICTYRCALHLWPDAPSHSNQVLRYFLGLDVSDMPTEAGATPHRAMYDAWVTAKLLQRMLSDHSVEELLRLTVEPVLLGTCKFGNKYRGRQWADVPADYLRWIARQDDMNPDVLHTARYYLNGGRLL